MSRCRQCGNVKPDTGWPICAACFDKNVEYEKQCVAEARKTRLEFLRKGANHVPARRGHAEMRGRRARHAVTASHQFEDKDDH